MTIVAAPVSAGTYPNSHRWKEHAALYHAVEVDADSAPVRVLCEKVKLESILPDSTQFNRSPVTCKTCLAKLRRLEVTSTLRQPKTSDQGRVCAICGKPGGTAATAVLQGLKFDIPRGQVGYAHTACMHKERKKLKHNEHGMIIPS